MKPIDVFEVVKPFIERDYYHFTPRVGCFRAKKNSKGIDFVRIVITGEALSVQFVSAPIGEPISMRGARENIPLGKLAVLLHATLETD